MDQSSALDSFDSSQEELRDSDADNCALNTLNKLIILLDVEHPRVSSLHQVSSNIYATIFEKVFGYKPLDLIAIPRTIEDEGHNVQCIIDTLSMDILGISLSHITGEDVVARRPMSIYHLLEILNKFVMRDSFQRESPGRSSVSVPLADSAASPTASNMSHHAHFCPVCEYAKARAASSQSSSTSPCPSCLVAGQLPDGRNRKECLDLPIESTLARSSGKPKTGSISTSKGATSSSCSSQKTQSSTSLTKEEPPNKRYKQGTSFNELLAQRLMQNLERINSKPKHSGDENKEPKMPLDDLYKSVFKPNRRKVVATPSKVTSVLLPRYLKRRRMMPVRSTTKVKTRPSPETNSCGQGIIDELKANVPGAHLSQDVLRCLEIQHGRQARFLSSRMAALKRRVPASQKMLQENVLKQVQLAAIAQRDLETQERLKEVKCLRDDRLRARGAITNNSIQKARVKRYFDQYHHQHRRKLSARNAKEETILEDLYKKRLALQKQQMHELNKDLRDEEREEAERLRKKMTALEKVYDDQSELQREHAGEKNIQKKTRVKAQRQELEQTRRAILNQIETEVKEIQENLEGMDDFHFIQADAERLKERWVHQK